MLESDALDALLVYSPDAVVVVGRDGEIVRVNEHAAGLFGYAPGDLVGAPVERLVPERFQTQHVQDRAVYAEHPRVRSMGAVQGIVARRADGTELDVDIKLAPLQLDGASGTVAVVRDISELVAMSRRVERHAERLEAVNHALDQFTCTVAHDLKGPLRTVSGYVHWLEEDLDAHLGERERDLFRRVGGACDRMRELIDGALTYARATDPELRGGAATVDLGAELRVLVRELDPGGVLEVSIVEMPTLLTHAVPLRQVFANLLVNAMNHGGEPPVRVRVSCDPERDFYRFRVSDDGPGIPEHAWKEVFQLFRSSGAGTGVGLSIVERLVCAYGGRVRLESPPGGGATFEFTWPKELDADD